MNIYLILIALSLIKQSLAATTTTTNNNKFLERNTTPFKSKELEEKRKIELIYKEEKAELDHTYIIRKRQFVVIYYWDKLGPWDRFDLNNLIS
jgi:hypothetical protein